MASEPPDRDDTPHGCPDPRRQYLAEFLRVLGQPESGRWWSVALSMAAHVASCIRDEAIRARRADVRERLLRIATAAGQLMEDTGREAVVDALFHLAPPLPGEPEDVPGFDTLAALHRRALGAAEAIRSGRGADTVGSILGHPNARLQCAAMALEAVVRATGKAAGERNERVLLACDALWRAAGGAPSPGARGGATDPLGIWRRYLRDVKAERTESARAAARTAFAYGYIAEREQQDRG